MMIPIGIKIQKNAARLQNTHPFIVCPIRMFQIPCYISTDNHIKCIISEPKRLCIHLIPFDFICQDTGIILCFFQHFFCIINSCHLIAGS